MMRDFTEVVADKTVTGNTDSYRFNPDGPHPHSADGTPAHAHVGGKRARSPPSSSSDAAPSTAQRDLKVRVVARETKTRHANHRPRRVQAAHRDQTQIRLGCRARAPRTDPRPRRFPRGRLCVAGPLRRGRVGKNLVDALDPPDSRRRRRGGGGRDREGGGGEGGGEGDSKEKDAAAKRENVRRAVAAAAALGRDAAGDVPEKENASPGTGFEPTRVPSRPDRSPSPSPRPRPHPPCLAS